MIAHGSVSRPGDPDLDIDLYNVVIKDLVRADEHFILEYEATDGRFLVSSSDDESRVGRKGDYNNITGSATFGFPSNPDSDYVRYVDQTLERWHSDGTELRLVGAPGKATQFFDPETGSWVLMPRSPARRST